MVSPVYLFIAALGAAFFFPIIKKSGSLFVKTIFLGVLVFYAGNSAVWLIRFLTSSGIPVENIFTAGFGPSLSIHLKMGVEEAFVTAAANFAALFCGILLMKRMDKKSPYTFMVYLLIVMGVNGLVMTRDLFNLFVFLEIVSISMYALIAMQEKQRAFSAGFKYMIAGGISSVLLLIGIAFVYRLTGTLNLDQIISQKYLLGSTTGMLAVFLVIAALLIELKPFPANGWALDVYQAIPKPAGALFSAVPTTGILFAFYKILPLCSPSQLQTIFLFSLAAFFFSNLLAIKQKSFSRLLGYSSASQVSLITAVLCWMFMSSTGNNIQGFIQAGALTAAGAFFITHLLAKAGLFWLADSDDTDSIKSMAGKYSRIVKIIPAVIFVLALTGFPPFPSFAGKWAVSGQFILSKQILPLLLLLGGSLCEIYYLFRWLIKSFKSTEITLEPEVNNRDSEILPVLLSIITAIGLVLIGVWNLHASIPLFWILIAAAAGLFLLDWLPVKVKGFLAMGLIGLYLWWKLPETLGGEFNLLAAFMLFFAAGGIIHLFSSMYKKGKSVGYIPLLTILILTLMQMVITKKAISFFAYWEIMTICTFFLILRGKKGQKAAFSFIIFSMISAYLLLSGLLSSKTGGLLPWYSMGSGPPLYSLLIIIAAVLVKLGSFIFHLWVPGAYGEAEDNTSSFLSSTASKIGILVILLLLAGTGGLYGTAWTNVLSWIGIITAFSMALLAVYQEDAKKLLAYSSISQLGYIVAALAMYNHLGWTTALYMVFNHFLFKGMLFLAIAGVIYRTKTRKMYKMGGLIKRMPLSFLSVLMAIIALSGVPPLSGFGGKWLLYSALIQKGWYFQAALAFFASAIAFLYLFRLIHSIFLGQAKDEHRDVKEAPVWIILPQVILMGALMLFSMFPKLIIQPIEQIVSVYGGLGFYDSSLIWNGAEAQSLLGYWNGNMVMYVTMGIFAVPLIFLMLVMRRPKHVEQFNIVFAAERPHRPETTHYAYNFFAHYQKALGFLSKPLVTRFWTGVNEFTNSIASVFRRIYSGNGQTYALHIILTVFILYFISGSV